MKSTHPILIISHNCASVNLSTSAWLQKSLAGVGTDSGKLDYYNGTTSVLQLGVGKAGKEQVLINLHPGLNSGIECVFPNNSPISLKALDAVATTGMVSINIYA